MQLFSSHLSIFLAIDGQSNVFLRGFQYGSWVKFQVQLCDGGYENQLVEDSVIDVPDNCVAVPDEFLDTAYHRPSNGGNMAQTRVEFIAFLVFLNN